MFAPAVLVAVPFLTGAAAALLLFSRLHQTPEILLAGAALLALIGAGGACATDDRADAAALLAAAAALAGLSLGLGDARRVYRTSLAAWFEATPGGTSAILRGRLIEDAAPIASGAMLLLEVTHVETPGATGSGLTKVRGGVRLSIAGTLHGDRLREWRAGRTVRVPAFLRLPSTYLNPGTPDERAALARKGIVLVGSVKSAALVEALARGTVVSEAAAAVRAAIRRRLLERLGRRDPRAAGVATAVLIGDRSGLTAEDERRLQEAGTYHVIAISGGNIAILAVAAMIVARLLLVRRAAGRDPDGGAAGVLRLGCQRRRVGRACDHGGGAGAARARARSSRAGDQRAGDRRAAGGRGGASGDPRRRISSLVWRHARDPARTAAHRGSGASAGAARPSALRIARRAGDAVPPARGDRVRGDRAGTSLGDAVRSNLVRRASS